MDDGVEVLLQVDPLRQAVGGDQDPGAFGRADLRHALLAFFGGHLAGHCLDGNIRQVLAQVAGHVVGGRDEAAEDHHVEPGLDQLRDVLRGGPELRIAAPARERLRLPDQPRQRRVFATGRGLHVVRDERVAVAVEDAIEELFSGLGAGVLSGTGAQGLHGRGGARPGAAQEGQRPPEVEALPQRVPRPGFDDLGAVVEDVVEERLPGAAEPVGDLLRLAAREEVALAPFREVGAPPLDEVPREAPAETCALRARGVRQTLEVRGEQAEEPVEGVVVAAVRGRGEQDEVPRRAAGQALEQLVALVPAAAGRGARMRLVDDHEVGARLDEAVPPLPGLHVVEADDRVRMHREDALARRNPPLQPPRAPGGDGRGADVEANLQLGDPLVHEMRRAEDGGALDVAAVEQLAGDEQGLDGLPDPDVVGDEEAYRVELQRHEQRHELVGARLDRDVSDAPEGSGAAAQREQQRIAEQEGRVVPAELVRARQGEPGLANRLDLERKVDQRPILVRSRDGTDPKRLRRASAEDDPLPPAGADEGSGGVGEAAHEACPRADASRAKAAFQPAGSSNSTTSKPRSSIGSRAGRSASSMSAAT